MKRIAFSVIVGGALTLALLLCGRVSLTPVASPNSQTPPPIVSKVSAPTNPLLGTRPVLTKSTAQPAGLGPTAIEGPAAMSAFAHWAADFLAGDASAGVARGEALAWKRREAMRELIETDPAQALKAAVPYRWREALPANITRHFEQWVDGTGALTVLVGTDFERGHTTVTRTVEVGGKTYQAFVYGRRSAQVSQTSIPLHGLALAGQLAVHADPVRLLEPGEAAALAQARGQSAEAICGVSGRNADFRDQRVAADLGGEVKYFCGVDHAELVNRRLLLAESGGNGGFGSLATAANDAWTHGEKNVLYMRVNFPDDLTEPISEAQAYNVMDEVNAFYTEGSYDVTSLDTIVTPLMTLPETKAWYSTAGPGALLGHAREAARRAGFETANYPLDIVAFTTVPDYDFGGLAAVYGKGVWLQSPGPGVTAHELGHNYGLWHANYWIATNSSVIGVGTNLEYGNIFDTMGNATAGNNQFNAAHKNILNWLPDPAVHSAGSNGVYRIYAFDAPKRIDGRFYAAKVAKDYERDYWIEFRQKFTGNPWLQSGVLLNWSPWEQSKGGTHLLDTTPGTLSRNDAALVIGRTFSDPGAGVHITPLARGMTGSEPWMDVQINLGPAPGHWPPFLSLEVDPTNAPPGQLVHFHATAVDLDGDTLAYAWSFDDGTFSTNNQPWAFKRWSQPGEHVVRCEVSDLWGGRASANAIVPVGPPVGFRLTGIVLAANDEPIEGVRVDNGNTNTTGYVVGYTDSDGVFVLTGLNGDYTLEATKYGYTFEPLNWQNPLTVSSNQARVDFFATALPTVRMVASTNAVTEASTARQTFTLTRTGEITNDLTVTVFLSGTADVGGDYSLTPALIGALTNAVVIPAGTQSVSIVFQVINDLIGEPDETVTLTIVDDPAYVVAAPGAATITILDDDRASVPVVSVAAVTPTIPENGMDRGTFLFTRKGNTQNELTVYYSVGGTATPGTDYSSLVGVVLLPAGSETATVQFQTRDDKILEPDETVTVAVNPDAAYSVSGSAATVTIIDDDFLTVTIFPTGAGAAEPASPGTFTVKRDGDLTANLSVFYTVSGTATSGSDFVPLSGSVILPAGATSADITLTPLDDSLLEGDESVVLTLATNLAYNIGTPGAATLLIRDDEKVSVSITATDGTASEPGDDTGEFRITRGSVVNGDLTVYLAISGTAISGVDYVPIDNPVVIPNGASSVSFKLIAFDDLHQELVEDVILTILPSTNYNIGSGPAVVRILDDDPNNVPAVGFSFSTSAAVESQSPGISVSLSTTSALPITVDYVVIGGTATSGIDYLLPPGTLTFDPTNRAKSIPLTILNDTLVEPNETIRVALFNPINATLDGIKIHTYTILDDDSASVSVTATVPSASETGPPANFRISRSGGTTAALQVNFELTGTASAPADYAPIGPSVTIPAGATFVDLPVVPTNDQTVEPAETVRLTLLTAPTAKIVSPNVATITLYDNDPDTLPQVVVTSTNQPAAVEGGSGGAFVFTRTGSTTGALVLSFSITGTAGNGADYAALSNSITIPIGQASVTLPVMAVDDSLIEGEETVIVSLTTSDTYRVAYPSAATVTIQDNDQRVWIDASDFNAAEPGTNPGEFTFTRFGTTNTPLQVFYTITGTAGNGVDYAAIPNSFVIPAGSLTGKLPIIPLDDSLVERSETVTLTLQSDAAYTLGSPTTATVTIQDDEPMVSLVADPAEVVEGSPAPGVFTVLRGGNPNFEFTARLAVGGTARYGVDYPPFFTNVFFGRGVSGVHLQIFPTNELVIEPAETITAVLVPDPAYTILAPSNAVITIVDAGTNRAPAITLTSPTANTIFLLHTNVNLILEATVPGAGGTNPPITITWTNVSGPVPVTFGNTNQTNSTVSFTNGGVYVLRLLADDGQLTNFTDLTVVVDAVERLTTNLLHWTLDQTNGAKVPDVSGNARHGVVVGDPTWTTNGVLGAALDLSGTNNYVRETLDSELFNGRKQFTLSLWTKSADPTTSRGLVTAGTNSATAPLTLSSRRTASSGSGSNLFEATFATSRGGAQRSSANNILTNGWQHLALTWSNGLAPALFLNGQLDQPLNDFVALQGVLTDSPQFLVGLGAADLTNSWRGLVDDVRVFPRALHPAEVAALVATNYGAIVTVPTNFTCPVLLTVTLPGTVTDDGRPLPPGVVSNTWSQIDGPVLVTITNADSLTNTVYFTQAGQYIFRLIADDAQVKTFADLNVTVIEPTLVNVIATDPEAAELGPDPGEITFSRVGDTNFNLTVYLTVSGAASNGVDFPFIPVTNSVTFPAGVDTFAYVLTPFLDDRTEGDELYTLTIVSNVAYTIGSGEATVTIHDSPYGVWNIAHFTLEELTDPTLSGQGVDFDHDGRANFVEYAANFDPKAPETNSPLTTAVELNPTNSLSYITLTYQRRLPPTDTAYGVYISPDLRTWYTGTNYVEEISATDDGNTLTETVKARLVAPYGTNTNTFLTVRVWLMTTGP